MMKTIKLFLLRYNDPNVQAMTIGLVLLFGSQIYVAFLLEGLDFYRTILISILMLCLMILAPWRVAAVLGALMVMSFIIDILWGFQTNHLLTSSEVSAFLYSPIHTLLNLASISNANSATVAAIFVLFTNIGLYMSLRYRYNNYDLTYTFMILCLLITLIYTGFVGVSRASVSLTKVISVLVT